MVIAITGPIASGKSTTAQALAVEVEHRGLNTAAIDLDLVYEMFEHRGLRKDDEAKWLKSIRAAGALAVWLLRAGTDVVIVEGDLVPTAHQEALVELVAAHHRLRFVTLRIPLEAALVRVDGDPSRTFSKDHDFLRAHYARREHEQVGLVVDTTQTSPSDAAAQIADWALSEEESHV